jgi:hypothetical protein
VTSPERVRYASVVRGIREDDTVVFGVDYLIPDDLVFCCINKFHPVPMAGDVVPLDLVGPTARYSDGTGRLGRVATNGLYLVFLYQIVIASEQVQRSLQVVVDQGAVVARSQFHRFS